jgi:hypothetical protein
MDLDRLMDCQGAQSWKEGQEDQGKVKGLGGRTILAGANFFGHWPSLFFVHLGSLAGFQAIPVHQA